MKRRNFLYLLFFQLIALTLLFPYTPNGRKAAERFFPPGNYGEDALYSEARDVSDALAAEEALKALGPPLSTYYTELSSELPGRYDLISVHAEDGTLSDELLARLHGLGFPMVLELHADGSAIYGVFDQAITPDYDAGSMRFTMNGKTLPFFYLGGALRIQDGNRSLIFEKQ